MCKLVSLGWRIIRIQNHRWNISCAGYFVTRGYWQEGSIPNIWIMIWVVKQCVNPTFQQSAGSAYINMGRQSARNRIHARTLVHECNTSQFTQRKQVMERKKYVLTKVLSAETELCLYVLFGYYQGFMHMISCERMQEKSILNNKESVYITFAIREIVLVS